MNILYEQNRRRIDNTIASVADGIITASAGAATLFHWLDDIVNERCAHFDCDPCETAPGDTPRVSEFSTNVGLTIVGYCLREASCRASIDEWETHARLADLARGFWGLLGTKKWISRGLPMAASDNWILDNLCNIFPEAEFYTKFPEAERKAKMNKDVVSYYRIIATLDERGGLHWLRSRSARTFRRIQTNAYDDTCVYSFAYVVEIMGKTLYNTREDFWVTDAAYASVNIFFETTLAREKGYCELNWQHVLAVIKTVAEDQNRSEEVRDVARKTAEKMVRIEEEVKQEREAKRLEEEAKNPKNGEETKS